MTSQIVAATSQAGGAALDQVIGLTAVALVIGAVLIWIGYLHRTRKITWVNTVAERFATKLPVVPIGARGKRPPWVALPVSIFTATLICALFGFIWDVSLHIGKGRDPGPLANPAHYFIIVGLFLLFVAGMAAVVIPYEKPGPAAVRITRTWYAPVGGLLIAGCGMYALIGFPLDDMWHRIFGQDVTLWGPTHLMMIGGAGFSTLAMLYLEYEGRRLRGPETPPDGLGLKSMRYLGFGGLVIGLSVFQIEFDFGVPQYRLVFQPMLIAAAGSFALVAARINMGRGGAILAVLFDILLRGLVALTVGPILGAPINWFPLYLGPAIVIELLALTPLFKRPVLFGLIGGLGVSTVGLWLESLWVGAVYHYRWPTSMWPEALAMAVPVAVLTGACGALAGIVLTGQRLPRRPVSIGLVVLMVLVIGGATANGLRYTVPENANAAINLTDLPSDTGKRMVSADVRINPPNLVSDNPEWMSILAWQGGLANDRGLVIDNLDRVGPGHYRSTRPLPVYGNWKTLLRVQDRRTLAAAAIYLAPDPAIGIPETPAQSSMTRPFVHEITILQRERSPDTPAMLWTGGCLVVLVCTLILVAALAWGGGRINNTEAPTGAKAETRPKVQA
ncbi:hypothetical protein [Mycobacterium sp.]|uniref:hypothetical protein n=1 Tax=Mycobacterium sp. TaxID=1785 RepID=UPI002D437DF8|nr:hypothetical protein [Mycobacterium sp.]HZA09997.1 hypothetical protein [Mycobacterium sp.]